MGFYTAERVERRFRGDVAPAQAWRSAFSVLGLSLLLLTSLPAQSAEVIDRGVQASANSGLTLSIALRGSITKGDAALLKAILDERGYSIFEPIENANHAIRAAVVTLDSSGGNFAEGLALAKLFLRRGVQTVVPAGAKCHSSCAIAFLGGRAEGLEGALFVSRSVEIGGELGFHAPYLVVPEGSYTPEGVESAYRVAVSTIADLIDFSEEMLLSTDVLPEVLNTEPQRMRILTDVDGFARFFIAFHPLPAIPHVTQSMVVNACQNGFGWGLSKELNAGRQHLRIGGALRTISVQSGYYSYEPVKVTRSIYETAEGGEGNGIFCIFDSARVQGRLHTSCRGLVEAPTIGDALEAARKIDNQQGLWKPDYQCSIHMPASARLSESADGNVAAMVPYGTRLENVSSILESYLRNERELTPE